MTDRRTQRRRRRDEDEPRPIAADAPQPHNLEAEKTVLGTILVNNRAFERVFAIINGSDFFRYAHRLIFEAMEELDERETPIDLVTLKELLANRGELEKVDGPAYIASLTDGALRDSNVEYHARIVREKAVLRKLIEAANGILQHAYTGDEDAEAILSQADRAIVDLQVNHGTSRMLRLGATTKDLLAAIEKTHENRGKILGISTGFPSIDDLTLGWQRGDMIVVAARPSIGKTTFVMNSVVAGAAAAGLRVAIFSLEMRRRQLEFRLLSSIARIPLTRVMLSNFLSDEEWTRLSEAISKMAEMRIEINDSARLNVHDIRAECRRLKADGGLDMVVIDYLQLMEGGLDNRRNPTRNDELADASRRLKVLADECAVPVIVLSQLNRTSVKADTRPKISDLRDTGALEQDADIIAFLHRRHHRENGYTSFIVEKQRQGPGGVLPLTIDRDIVTFTDGCDEAEQAKHKGDQ